MMTLLPALLLAAWLPLRNWAGAGDVRERYRNADAAKLASEAARRAVVQRGFTRDLRERIVRASPRMVGEAELASYASTAIGDVGGSVKSVELAGSPSSSASPSTISVTVWFDGDIEVLARALTKLESGALELRIAAMEVTPARIDGPGNVPEVIRTRLRIEALWESSP